jgi:hypothetical protein
MRFPRSGPLKDGSGVTSGVGCAEAGGRSVGVGRGVDPGVGEGVADVVGGATLAQAASRRQSADARSLIGLGSAR